MTSADAAKSAANTQADASRNATAVEQAQFQQTRTDLAPYMAQGKIGLDQLNQLMRDPSMVTKMPGYQFQMQQGTEAIDHSAAAGGFTGNTLRALDSYGQGLASSSYGNLWQQLYQMANLGQTSAAGVGNIGASTAANIGGNIIGAGNAQAAGQVGSASAINTGVSNGLQNYLLAMQSRPTTTYDPSVTAGVGQGWGSTDYSLSDVWLKTDIQRTGVSPRGYPTYEWTWRVGGGRGTGVIAQEVALTDPSAVVRNADGFLMVDYAKV
ncbi:MAG: hypothetical protein M3N82_05445 [Pseudomonadota bacterium]|nr:hypothetical protein [Pseudomonadota bacterium]